MARNTKIDGLFLEVFAGSARMTAAFRAHPHFRDRVSDPWDMIYGEMFDLLVETNLRKLLNLLASGHIAGTWLGTPCTSFTLARRWDGGPPPLRDPGDVLLAAPWISSEHDLKSVETGNRLASVTVRIILVAYQARAWYVIENGIRTRLWEIEELKEAFDVTKAESMITDYRC